MEPLFEDLNNEKFTYEIHTRDLRVFLEEVNNIDKSSQFIRLLHGEKTNYADKIVGYTKNPPYVSFDYQKAKTIVYGIMFEKNGEDFWIHVPKRTLKDSFLRAFGRETGTELFNLTFNEK